MGDAVNTEPVNTQIQPELQNILHFLLHLVVSQVQVGLLLVKLVQVVLATIRIEFPSGSSKDRLPVVWWTAVGPISPHVVVRVLPFFPHRLLEPIVLIGRVVWNKISDHLDVLLMHGCQ